MARSYIFPEVSKRGPALKNRLVGDAERLVGREHLIAPDGVKNFKDTLRPQFVTELRVFSSGHFIDFYEQRRKTLRWSSASAGSHCSCALDSWDTYQIQDPEIHTSGKVLLMWASVCAVSSQLDPSVCSVTVLMLVRECLDSCLGVCLCLSLSLDPSQLYIEGNSHHGCS